VSCGGASPGRASIAGKKINAARKVEAAHRRVRITP